MKGGDTFFVNKPIVIVSVKVTLFLQRFWLWISHLWWNSLLCFQDINLYCLAVVKSDDVSIIGREYYCPHWCFLFWLFCWWFGFSMSLVELDLVKFILFLKDLRWILYACEFFQVNFPFFVFLGKVGYFFFSFFWNNKFWSFIESRNRKNDR